MEMTFINLALLQLSVRLIYERKIVIYSKVRSAVSSI